MKFLQSSPKQAEELSKTIRARTPQSDAQSEATLALLSRLFDVKPPKGGSPAKRLDKFIDSNINFRSLIKIDDVIKGMDLSNAPPKVQQQLEMVFGGYFDALPVKMKREVWADIIQASKHGKDSDVLFSAAIGGAGPIMQKVIQLIGDQANSPELQVKLSKFKDNVKTMEREQVEQVYKEIGGDQIFSKFEIKSIAAGTISQAHMATLKDGTQVVVKVKRVGIEKTVEKEMDLFEKMAKENPIMEDLVRGAKKSINEELSFKDETKNLKLGQGYKSLREGIDVISEVNVKISDPEKVMILTKADGVPITKANPKILEEQLQVSLSSGRLLAKWLKRSLIGDGFFHGDLHAGNIFIDFKKKKITLIDFGNAGSLSKKEQKGIRKLIPVLFLTKSFKGFEKAASLIGPPKKGMPVDIQEKFN